MKPFNFGINGSSHLLVLNTSFHFCDIWEPQKSSCKPNNQLWLYWGFNRCSFQLLRAYKNMKRTRVRLDRNVAPCSRPTTNVIGPLHECKKVCPFTKALPQSGFREWIKQCRRKRKKRDRKEWGQEADGKKGSPTRLKPIWGTKTRPT